eukprot:3245742-Pleurochrysis_carterae.AAC.5
MAQHGCFLLYSTLSLTTCRLHFRDVLKTICKSCPLVPLFLPDSNGRRSGMISLRGSGTCNSAARRARGSANASKMRTEPSEAINGSCFRSES